MLDPRVVVSIFLFAKFVLIFLVQENNAPTVLDEVAYVLLFPYAVLAVLYKNSLVRRPLALFLGYAVFAILGALLSGVRGVPQPYAALLDVALDSKLIVFFCASVYMLSRLRSVETYHRHLARLLVWIALLNLPFVIRDVFLSGGYSIRGLPLINRLGFYQPHGLFFIQIESAWFSLFGVFSALFLSLTSKNRGLYIAIGVALSVVVLMHFAAKETIALLIGLLVYQLRSGTTKNVLGTIFVGVLAIGIVFFLTPSGDVVIRQIAIYAGSSSEDTVRTALTLRSFDVALQYFPLGSGGGTFASAASYQLGYSDLYYQYGISELYGGSEDSGNFLTDVFWPKYLAQGGFFGAFLYLCLFSTIYLNAIRYWKYFGDASGRYVLMCALSCLVLSVGSAPFVNEVFGLLFASLMASAAVELKRRMS